jgi:hypothetical protein
MEERYNESRYQYDRTSRAFFLATTLAIPVVPAYAAPVFAQRCFEVGQVCQQDALFYCHTR